MKAATPYIHLHERKRTWTPVQVSAGTLLDGGEEVVQRALALRCLEIPVGDFISEAMKGDLPDIEGCRELLLSNVTDEENHDIALNYRGPGSQDSELALKRRPSVLRMRGWNWTAIRSLRPWFLSVPSSLSYSQSSDSSEILGCAPQVRTYPETSRPTWLPIRSYVKSSVLNLTKSSISLEELRLLGCFSPSKGRHTHKHLSSNFWMASSDSLVHPWQSRRATEHSCFTSMPAFFETNNVNLPQYA